MKEDEELARKLYDMEVNGNAGSIYENPLEYEGIPPKILKLIYKILIQFPYFY